MQYKSVFLKRLFFRPTTNILVQMFRYAWVSAIAYLVDAGCFYLLIHFAGIYYLIATVISSMLGGTANYFMSITPTMFGSTMKNKWLEFALFTALGVGSLVINLAVMWLMVDHLHCPPMAAKIVSIIGVFLWTFFSRRYLFMHGNKRVAKVVPVNVEMKEEDTQNF